MERTGLDKTQLKHWFNNARKRILKPLLHRGIEEAPGATKKGGSKRKRRRDGETSVDGRGPVGVAGERESSLLEKKRRDKADGEDRAENSAASLSGKVNNNNVFNDKVHSTGNTSSMCFPEQCEENQHILQQQRQVFERWQPQILLEEQEQNVPQFDDSFRHSLARLDNTSFGGGGGNGKNIGNDKNIMIGGGNISMSQNQYNRQSEYLNNCGVTKNNTGMLQFGDMVGYEDSMGDMMNGCNSRISMNNNRYGGVGTDRYLEGRGNNGSSIGRGEFDNPVSNSRGNINRAGSLGYNQAIKNNNNTGNNSTYCQPISTSSCQGGISSEAPNNSVTASKSAMDNSARSNAVFKQQVASMAMNEAMKAFKDMEDAFAHAKGVLAASRTKRSRLLLQGLVAGILRPPVDDPEDDPLVLAAHAHTKKCQSVAMFKLKVSQRASEEAANAYDSYQQMVEGTKVSDDNITGNIHDVTGR